jgi:metal-responsive CopG/Arc/MetJ family transcriptional regulator
MKTAVSIPDDVFARAERLAKRSRKSRSQLYSDAVREYIARHSPEDITKAMNRVCDQVPGESDALVRTAVRRTLERVEW